MFRFYCNYAKKLFNRLSIKGFVDENDSLSYEFYEDLYPESNQFGLQQPNAFIKSLLRICYQET